MTIIGIIAVIILYVMSIYNGINARRAQIKMVKKSLLKNIQNAFSLLNKQCSEVDIHGAVDTLKNITQINANNDELNDINKKIKSDIDFYNKLVNGLNSQIQTFPINLVAKLFNIIPEKIIINGDL